MTRIAFIDAPHRDGWRDTGALAGLSGVAGELARRGHEVSLAGFAHWQLGHELWPDTVRRQTIPLIERPAIEVAPGGLDNGRAAYDALCVAQWLDDNSFDVVVLAEFSGLAAYQAMAAAACPQARNPAVIVWSTGGTRAGLLGERRPARLADLVSDALERVALAAADLVIVPRGCKSPVPSSLALPALPPGGEPAQLSGRKGAIADIALIGPVSEASGALHFMDAIEKLQANDLLAGRSVTFVGPARDEGRGLTAATIAVRAAKWNFDWKIRGDLSARDALALASEPQRLSIFAGSEECFPGLLAGALEAGAAVIARRTRQTRALIGPGRHKYALYSPAPGALARSIAAVLGDPAALALRPAVATGEAVDLWADALEGCRRPKPVPQRPRRGGKPRVSVCVIHRDRPQLLQRALASIAVGDHPGEVEIILVDDASSTPDAHALLAELALECDRKPLKIIRNSQALFPAAARNRAAAAASGDCLVFLDDDNWLLAGGLDRLSSGVTSGRYDVVTSALEVEQPGIEPGRPPLRVAFLGDAGLAGLVFNGFGDASLAIRRKAFERIGGFPDEGALAPGEDWVFLARCRAAGLRMASLWQPCFGYRKPVDLARTSWRKNHKEGALARVRQAYGGLGGDDLQLALAYLHGLDLASRQDD